MTTSNHTPETLKAWRARLGLSELAMSHYIGVPVFTLRKWENGTRKPDAAPLALLALLETIETQAPALHAARVQSAKQNAPAETPKTRGRGKGAPGAKKRASGPDSAPAAPSAPVPSPADAPPPWVHVSDAVPDWMKSSV